MMNIGIQRGDGAMAQVQYSWNVTAAITAA